MAKAYFEIGKDSVTMTLGNKKYTGTPDEVAYCLLLVKKSFIERGVNQDAIREVSNVLREIEKSQTGGDEAIQKAVDDYGLLQAAEIYSDWYPSHANPAGALVLLIIAAVLILLVLGTPILGGVFIWQTFAPGLGM